MASEKRALREEKEPHIQNILMPFIFRIVQPRAFLVRRARKMRVFCMQTARIVKKRLFLKKNWKNRQKRFFGKILHFLAF